jgi:hypothetical protein
MWIIRTYTYNIYSSLDMYSHMVICIYEPGPPTPGGTIPWGVGARGPGSYIYICMYTYICVCACYKGIRMCLSLSLSLPLQARLPLLGIELKLDLMMAPSRMCLA